MAANDLTHTNSASTTLDLNDGVIYSLLEPGPSGLFNVPYENILVDTPMRRPRGVLVAANPLARVIEIPIMVHGNRSQLITRLRALQAHFAVDKRDSAQGTLQYEADNNQVRACRVLPWADDVSEKVEWLRSNPTARGWAIVTVQLMAADPAVYNPTAVTPSGALSGTSSVNISCANAGDEDAWIQTMVIAAVATNVKITDAYGTWLQFNDALAGAETLTLVLVPGALSMTHSVDGSWLNKRVSGSGVPLIKHGTNNLVVEGDDGGDNGAVNISFYSTYSGHG